MDDKYTCHGLFSMGMCRIMCKVACRHPHGSYERAVRRVLYRGCTPPRLGCDQSAIDERLVFLQKRLPDRNSWCRVQALTQVFGATSFVGAVANGKWFFDSYSPEPVQE